MKNAIERKKKTVFTKDEKDLVYSSLNKILMTDPFLSSERLRGFLAFVVSETLEGRGAGIKSYTIAIDVFSKRHDFDSVQDPVVRITAGRLRQALDLYNAAKLKQDDVKISLPKGKYVPLFEFPDELGASDELIISKRPSFLSKFLFWAICLAVSLISAIYLFVKFDLLPGGGRGSPKNSVIIVENTESNSSQAEKRLANALTRELFRHMASHGSVKIMEFDDLKSLVFKDINLADIFSDVFLLRTELHIVESNVHLDWRLLSYPDKIILWSESTQTEPISSFSIKNTANGVTSSILGMDGVLPKLSSRSYINSFDDRNCMLASRRFIFEYDFKLRERAKDCLEKIVLTSPDNIDAWSALSIVYLSFARFAISMGEDPSEYQRLYRVAIDRVEKTAKNTYLGQMALMYGTMADKDIDAFNIISQRLLSSYNGDPGLRTRIGGLLVITGNYAEGAKLLQSTIEAFEIDQGLAYLALALERYVSGDYQAAIDLAGHSGLEDYYLTALLRVVASAEIGDRSVLDAAKQTLNTLRPGYEKNIYQDLEERFYDEAIIQKIGESMKKAGFTVAKVPM